MKENPYFKFYTAEWLQGRITLEDLEVQGLFVNICAWYWHFKGDITVYHILKRTNNPVGFEKLTEANIIRLSDEQNIYENKKLIISFLDEQLGQRGVVCARNKANGNKGGRPKKTQSVILNNPNDNPNITNIDKIREEKIREKESKKKNFLPPTLFEVVEYFSNNGYTTESANKAYEYYQVANWIDSKGNKVKNWKQKMQGVWFKDENKVKSTQPTLEWK